MRYSVILSLALACSFAGTAWARDSQVEKPIRQLEQGFNKGDIKLAKSAHVAMPEIVDDIAPFHWSGKGSFDRWLANLVRSEKAEGKTGGAVALGEPLVEKVSGTRAYVVTPSTYTFRQGGKTFRETGTMTFVLTKTAAGWKIAGWTWSSPESVPVG